MNEFITGSTDRSINGIKVLQYPSIIGRSIHGWMREGIEVWDGRGWDKDGIGQGGDRAGMTTGWDGKRRGWAWLPDGMPPGGGRMGTLMHATGR